MDPILNLLVTAGTFEP